MSGMRASSDVMDRISDEKISAGGLVATWVITLLGLWLIFAPSVFRLETDNSAFWNELIVGIALAALGLVALRRPEVSLSAPRRSCHFWPGLWLGLWLVFSPWVLEYSDGRGASVNEVIVGLATLAAAALAIFRRADHPSQGKGDE